MIGKHFKYAFGEIILVFVKILIALSIHNWNENWKDRIQEQIILKSLRVSPKRNLKLLNIVENSNVNTYNSSLN